MSEHPTPQPFVALLNECTALKRPDDFRRFLEEKEQFPVPHVPIVRTRAQAIYAAAKFDVLRKNLHFWPSMSHYRERFVDFLNRAIAAHLKEKLTTEQYDTLMQVLVTQQKEKEKAVLMQTKALFHYSANPNIEMLMPFGGENMYLEKYERAVFATIENPSPFIAKTTGARVTILRKKETKVIVINAEQRKLMKDWRGCYRYQVDKKYFTPVVSLDGQFAHEFVSRTPVPPMQKIKIENFDDLTTTGHHIFFAPKNEVYQIIWENLPAAENTFAFLNMFIKNNALAPYDDRMSCQKKLSIRDLFNRSGGRQRD